MKTFKQTLYEIKISDPVKTLERHGNVEEHVDAKTIEIELEATYNRTMYDGTIIDMPCDNTWIRLRKFSSDRYFELNSIQVANQLRGGATIALALVKRAREIAGEPIILSDVRSPDGKRLSKALERLNWTETINGREVIK